MVLLKNIDKHVIQLYLPANHLMMYASTTATEILEESLHVSQTKTEWELVHIQVTPVMKEIRGEVFACIIYSVSIFESLHCEFK